MPFIQENSSSHPCRQGGGSSDDFEELVQQLSDVLGPCSGLDSEEIDPGVIQQMMRSYTSKESEWEQYALLDPSKHYTRNLVDEGNGKSNLLILVWSPGRGSPIHDHANAHCVMKILKGSLTETIYEAPNPDKPCTPKMKRTRIYAENEVTYISDKIGVHKISNTSEKDLAVSLHLYTPPHAANFGFNLFDEKTGRPTHIKQAGFFSNRGEKLDTPRPSCFSD